MILLADSEGPTKLNLCTLKVWQEPLPTQTKDSKIYSIAHYK